uniref:Pentatricopeptide repeat-containing protein n=1 Tax=Ananas comosus var. bracteatus TaxID=296719 RepID=A0A6V7NVK5_ANACO|nr:unnamed protein product [Ananas comosus var. bracteatus]
MRAGARRRSSPAPAAADAVAIAVAAAVRGSDWSSLDALLPRLSHGSVSSALLHLRRSPSRVPSLLSRLPLPRLDLRALSLAASLLSSLRPPLAALRLLKDALASPPFSHLAPRRLFDALAAADDEVRPSDPSLPLDLLLQAYTGLVLPEKGLQVFSLMKGANFVPKIKSCNSLLSALVKANQIEKAWILYAAMFKTAEVDVLAFTESLCFDLKKRKNEAIETTYSLPESEIQLQLKWANQHGNISETHMHGYPMIICMDPVLDSCEWHSLRKAIRSMLGLISPTMTRDQLHAKTDVLVISFVKKWGGQVVDIHEMLKERPFEESKRGLARSSSHLPRAAAMGAAPRRRSSPAAAAAVVRLSDCGSHGSVSAALLRLRRSPHLVPSLLSRLPLPRLDLRALSLAASLLSSLRPPLPALRLLKDALASPRFSHLTPHRLFYALAAANDELRPSDPSLPFDLLLRAYTDLALPEKGLRVFSFMRGANIVPKIKSCNSLLSALVKANQIEKAWILKGESRHAEELVKEMVSYGMTPDDRIYASLIEGLDNDNELNKNDNV